MQKINAVRRTNLQQETETPFIRGFRRNSVVRRTNLQQETETIGIFFSRFSMSS